MYVKHRYLQQLSDFDIIGKFFLGTSLNIPRMKQMKIYISIRDLNLNYNLDFLKAKLILELLAGRCPFIYRSMRFSKKSSVKRLYFLVYVTLKSSFMYNFLYFFSNFVYLNLKMKRNFLDYNFLKNKKCINFTVKEIFTIPGFDEKFFRWKYPLSFIFFFNSLNIRQIDCLLRNYSLFIFRYI